MLTRILGLIHLWDDANKENDLFVPPESLLSIEAQGHQEFSAGRFRLEPADPPFPVPRGSVASVRAALIVVEGAPGADLTINGAGAARQLRPATDAENAAELTPRAFYLETCADLNAPAPFLIAHPGPPTAEPIVGRYVLVGDPVA